MLSNRCKTIVQEELRKLDIAYAAIDLGEVDLLEKLSLVKREKLKNKLLQSGMELMDNKKAMLIEKIKNVVIEMVHHTDEMPKINFSNFLSEKLGYDYTYLATLFSVTEGTTIERFIIVHKIERVKELILY